MIRIWLLLVLLAGCAAPPVSPATKPPPSTSDDAQLPPYIRRPYEPFSRMNAVAIAQREWRAFGSGINDDAPGPDLPRELRPDKQPGLWQRVADYWWQGQELGTPESEWSSLYNGNGTQYAGPAPAWSAAFISYIMRSAGAGGRFPYTPLHADYINAAARGEGVLRAERPETYSPVPGDLICYGRAGAQGMRFDKLPAPRFFGHCDMVVDAVPGQLSVVGGNVEGSVTMKHVPTATEGTLAGAGGVVDSRYPWFVVLHVLYDG